MSSYNLNNKLYNPSDMIDGKNVTTVYGEPFVKRLTQIKDLINSEFKGGLFSADKIAPVGFNIGSPLGIAPFSLILAGIKHEDRKNESDYKSKFDRYILNNFIRLEKLSAGYASIFKKIHSNITNKGEGTNNDRIITNQLDADPAILKYYDDEIKKELDSLKSTLSETKNNMRIGMPEPEIPRFNDKTRYYSRITYFHLELIKKDSFMNKAFKMINKYFSRENTSSNGQMTIRDVYSYFFIIEAGKIINDGLSSIIKMVFGNRSADSEDLPQAEIEEAYIEDISLVEIYDPAKNWLTLDSRQNKAIFDHNRNNTDHFDLKLKITTDKKFWDEMDPFSADDLSEKVIKALRAGPRTGSSPFLDIDSGADNYGVNETDLNFRAISIERLTTKGQFAISFKWSYFKAKKKGSNIFFNPSRSVGDMVEVIKILDKEGNPVKISGIPCVLYASNKNNFVKNASGAVTQTLYSTEDEDGNEIVFTAADLVQGGGKVRSKSGKKFSPKKYKPKGLSLFVQKWNPKG